MHISKLNILKWAIGIGALLTGAIFLYALRAPDLPYASREVAFIIEKGEGLSAIADRLQRGGLIKSPFAFKAFAVLRGTARTLKSGTYALNTSMSSSEILAHFQNGSDEEAAVRIFEGASVFEVDEALADAEVLKKGALIAYAETRAIEGTLFPDTYRFFKNTEIGTVVEKFKDNFKEKAEPLLAKDAKNRERNLTLASLLEKEVPDAEERRVVAGILLKRVAEGMPLQVDASVCYAKEIAARADVPCYPLTALDMQAPSPYNTYEHLGWPPGPIGSPGVSALTAAMNPVESPYWYYLSDPKTSRTIFSITLEEHTKNRVRYLKK